MRLRMAAFYEMSPLRRALENAKKKEGYASILLD